MVVVCALASLLAPALAGPAPAAPPAALPPDADEYTVKAAFIYNFLLFVDWPSSSFDTPDTAVSVCVAGRDAFDGGLDRALTGKTAKGRRIEVRHLDWGPEVRRCHVLFVATREARRVRDLTGLLAGAAVLTIADEARAGGDSCIVGFLFEDHRVGFEIDVDLAARAGLTISSKVLKLARIRRGSASASGGHP